MTGRRPWLIPALVALVLVLMVISIMVGRVMLGWDAWTSHDVVTRAIFFELRVPRALLGALIGVALGLSGAAMQGYLRNPLADPGVLGVSALSALGAVMSIFFGIAGLHPWAMPIAGVLGGLVGMAALFLLAGATASVLTLVLAGVILNALGSAGTSLALSISPNPWAAGEMLRWLMGALTDRSFDELIFATPLILIGAVAILFCGRALDALTLGEQGARSLGINLDRMQWVLASGVGLAVGASVAVTGVIGFVGLVVPHLMRPLVGSSPRALLVPSALGGAALVLAGDIVVRLLPGGSEVQLGVAMSLIGAPFFLFLMHSLRRKLT